MDQSDLVWCYSELGVLLWALAMFAQVHADVMLVKKSLATRDLVSSLPHSPVALQVSHVFYVVII
jgi:hypothetical protein